MTHRVRKKATARAIQSIGRRRQEFTQLRIDIQRRDYEMHAALREMDKRPGLKGSVEFTAPFVEAVAERDKLMAQAFKHITECKKGAALAQRENYETLYGPPRTRSPIE